jgi:hypothetical protein
MPLWLNNCFIATVIALSTPIATIINATTLSGYA